MLDDDAATADGAGDRWKRRPAPPAPPLGGLLDDLMVLQARSREKVAAREKALHEELVELERVTAQVDGLREILWSSRTGVKAEPDGATRIQLEPDGAGDEPRPPAHFYGAIDPPPPIAAPPPTAATPAPPPPEEEPPPNKGLRKNLSTLILDCMQASGLAWMRAVHIAELVAAKTDAATAKRVAPMLSLLAGEGKIAKRPLPDGAHGVEYALPKSVSARAQAGMSAPAR